MCKSLNVAVNKCINLCFVHLFQDKLVGLDKNHEFTEAVNFGTCCEF